MMLVLLLRTREESSSQTGINRGLSVAAASIPLVVRLRAGMARLARWLYPGFGVAPSQVSVRPIAAREPKRGGENPGAGAAVITRTRTQTKRPNMYRVLLLNDDYTPMEFVVSILQAFFNKDAQEAMQIMLQVHNNGVGECGIFSYEIAETKVSQVMDHARKNQHPLQCIMEKK
jgi:ATP-dependent Clp protease adaptor protein ClpS